MDGRCANSDTEDRAGVMSGGEQRQSPDEPWNLDARLEKLLLDTSPEQHLERALEAKKDPTQPRMIPFLREEYLRRVAFVENLLDRDEHIRKGKQVFGYSIPDARKALEAYRKALGKGGSVIQVTPGLVLKDVLMETVYNPALPSPFQLAVYHASSHQVEYAEQCMVSGITYAPKQWKQSIIEQVVSLPSEAVPYGTTSLLFRDVRRYLTKYVQLSDPAWYDLTASYVFLTWVFDRLSVLRSLSTRMRQSVHEFSE